jgi:hypothetical protein
MIHYLYTSRDIIASRGSVVSRTILRACTFTYKMPIISMTFFQANATRHCTDVGQWYWSIEQNSTWTNYTHCFRDQLVTVLMDLSDVQPDNVTSIGVRLVY